MGKSSGKGQPGRSDGASPPGRRALHEEQQEACQRPALKNAAKGGRLLIVGCGNPAAGDDSAGIEIVRRLGELGDCGCDLRAETAPGVGLLDIFSLADVILFVDAVTCGGAPGTIYLTSLPSKELESRAPGALSSHGWGLAETLELAHGLGRTIPRLFLLGIEAGTVTQGAPRSPAVEQAIALVVERISDLRLLLLTSEVMGTRSFPPGDRSFPGE
jgi:hydrogenase maturation protease